MRLHYFKIKGINLPVTTHQERTETDVGAWVVGEEVNSIE